MYLEDWHVGEFLQYRKMLIKNGKIAHIGKQAMDGFGIVIIYILVLTQE